MGFSDWAIDELDSRKNAGKYFELKRNIKKVLDKFSEDDDLEYLQFLLNEIKSLIEE
jgi:hypothetical protein